MYINPTSAVLLAALLCCGGSIRGAAAWTARGVYHNDAHPCKCFISETLIISPGETVKSPRGCSNIRCDNEDGSATLIGCGAVGAPPGCEWGEYINVHAPFQECCARHLICKDGMTNETRAFHEHIINMFKTSMERRMLSESAAAQEKLE